MIDKLWHFEYGSSPSLFLIYDLTMAWMDVQHWTKEPNQNLPIVSTSTEFLLILQTYTPHEHQSYWRLNISYGLVTLWLSWNTLHQTDLVSKGQRDNQHLTHQESNRSAASNLPFHICRSGNKCYFQYSIPFCWNWSDSESWVPASLRACVWLNCWLGVTKPHNQSNPWTVSTLWAAIVSSSLMQGEAETGQNVLDGFKSRPARVWAATGAQGFNC